MHTKLNVDRTNILPLATEACGGHYDKDSLSSKYTDVNELKATVDYYITWYTTDNAHVKLEGKLRYEPIRKRSNDTVSRDFSLPEWDPAQYCRAGVPWRQKF